MKLDWQLIVSFKTELFSEYLIQRGYQEDLRKLLPSIGLMQHRMIIDNDIFVDLAEVDNIKKALSNNLFKEADNAYRVIENESKLLLDLAENISSADITSLEVKELINLFDKFIAQYQKALSLIGIPTIIDLVVEELLRAKLADYTQDIDHLVASLAKPNQNLLAANEEKDLLGIRNYNGVKEELIRKHAKKYGWLHTTLFLGEPYSEQEIIEKLKNSPKKFEKSTEIKINFEKDDGELIKLFQEVIYYRTARLEWLNIACYKIRPLINKIADSLGLTYEEVIYSLTDELLAWLKGDGKPDRGKIKERIDKYALISDGDFACKLFTGRKVADLAQIFRRRKSEKNSEIKGLIACPGIATGRATVVADRTDLYKVSDGDIMIAKLTTPDFVVAMRKAAGIVTDLGGMTSHAAIVSRELKIPCIVGTKNATQVLKDGEMVQVDADKGVVSILTNER